MVLGTGFCGAVTSSAWGSAPDTLVDLHRINPAIGAVELPKDTAAQMQSYYDGLAAKG